MHVIVVCRIALPNRWITRKVVAIERETEQAIRH